MSSFGMFPFVLINHTEFIVRADRGLSESERENKLWGMLFNQCPTVKELWPRCYEKDPHAIQQKQNFLSIALLAYHYSVTLCVVFFLDKTQTSTHAVQYMYVLEKAVHSLQEREKADAVTIGIK